MSERLIVLNNENPAICAPCGGQCCKHMPGAASPEDFGAPDREAMRDRLRTAFDSGLWAIDWWEGDPRDDRTREVLDKTVESYYPRPRVVGVDHVYDPSYGGQCVLLVNDRCSLVFDQRPVICRELVPKRGRCTAEIEDKQRIAVAWIPYHDLLSEVPRDV